MNSYREKEFKPSKKLKIVDSLLEESNLFLAKNDLSELIVSTDFFTEIDFRNLPQVHLSKEKLKCSECGLIKHYITSIRNFNRISYICSLDCLKDFLESYTLYMLRNLRIGNNFVCNRCELCKKEVNNDCTIGMLKRFCNEDCLELYQKKHFELCYLCKKQVGLDQLGKYSFYRNQRVFQLCGQLCQEQFKRHKTCQFCGNSLTSTFYQFIIKQCKKNFCNKDCCDKYVKFLDRTDITKRRCSICEIPEISDNFIEIGMKFYKLFVCSRICFYIFFELNSMISGKVIVPYFICMYCRRIMLRNNEVVIAYNNKCQLFQFCSHLCKWSMIWHNSKESYDTCQNCSVRKHHYDFIYYKTENETSSFCSIWCHKSKEQQKHIASKVPIYNQQTQPQILITQQQSQLQQHQLPQLQPVQINGPIKNAVSNVSHPLPKLEQANLSNVSIQPASIAQFAQLQSANLQRPNATGTPINIALNRVGNLAFAQTTTGQLIPISTANLTANSMQSKPVLRTAAAPNMITLTKEQISQWSQFRSINYVPAVNNNVQQNASNFSIF